MTDWSKAIQTLAELPSTNPTIEELSAERASFPSFVQIAAREEVTRQLDPGGAELSPYGYLREQVLVGRKIMEVVVILGRAKFKVVGA